MTQASWVPSSLQLRLRPVIAMTVAALALSLPSVTGADGTDPIQSTDVVSRARLLSGEEVRASDISGTIKADRLLAAHLADTDTPAKEAGRFRVYDFGVTSAVIDVATPFRVEAGENEEGQVVQDVILSTGAKGFAASSAYVVPPSSAFKHYEDNTATLLVGSCWKRVLWWTVTKANNYASGGSTYDYYRMYGKVSASTLTGCGANDGFRRAWIEFDRRSGWSTVVEFETQQPDQSYGGGGTTTQSIGFSSGFNVNLGVPPLTAGGTTNTTYGGSIVLNTENWHPIQRAEAGSGGVQWCRYTAKEFTGTRTFASRVPARIADNGTMNDWDILSGQQGAYTNCPSQQ